jgi:hypothetical protein
MQTLLTILTALSLATHAMAGCCWHHAHSCACDGLSEVASAEAESCCQHCSQAEHKQHADSQVGHSHNCDAHPNVCHSAVEHDESSAPPAPCDCKIECHGTCTYLPPEKSPVDSAADGPAFAQPVVALLDNSSTDLLSANWEWLTDPVESAQPLRIHLLHQVLLI